MQTTDIAALKSILNHLPTNIREALETYAQETDLPIEFVIEMAIASFLDIDAVTFSDCRIESPGRLREQVETLQIQLAAAKAQLPQP
ncbi:MAG: hypothetical protein J0L70_30915 [Leptolyngbya sp. UWPOB_LEPTO1]|uniref:hypothetical protein n=1 Tax=Leptolyngbya sp. UWPOB_LEPTO1 TaxID=2815653 RepID=UPI001AD43AA6|nr:hypothetical protein [Leptolyngbya sp. UWPOB_LEPTO1]MBN8564929.1 hypothetical protein [Leptolyngbya sp. UWPOB_LEPTO1]